MKFGRLSLAKVTFPATAETRNIMADAKAGVVSDFLYMRLAFRIGQRLDVVARYWITAR